MQVSNVGSQIQAQLIQAAKPQVRPQATKPATVTPSGGSQDHDGDVDKGGVDVKG
jgi:hypothetical protein